jgi:hypothetical protein
VHAPFARHWLCTPDGSVVFIAPSNARWCAPGILSRRSTHEEPEAVRQPSTTLVAVFEDRFAAEEAVDELAHSGFRSEQIGYAIRGQDAVAGGMITDAEGAKDAHGAIAGIATGAGVGAALGAASALLVPGIGPVLASGVLAMALGGAFAGSAIGGIYGALTGLEISEQEARFYTREFQSGRAIVAVRAGQRICDAAVILRRYGGYDLQDRPVSPVSSGRSPGEL